MDALTRNSSSALLALALLPIPYFLFKRRAQSQLPLPPGPPKSFLVGNLPQLPKALEWETYHQWSTQYDTDIIHVDALGTSIIVLDSYEACFDLFERRSSLYSSRPRLPMINELMGWDWDFAFMPYGNRWRAHRRMFHLMFHEKAAMEFRPLETRACHDFLTRLLLSPENLIDHIRNCTAQVIMPVTYGLDVKRENDPFVELADAAVRTLNTCVQPGRYLVDVFPILKYVPKWFPGAYFQREAAEWRILGKNARNLPYQAAKANFERNGETYPSLVSKGLADAQEMEREEAEDHEELLANVAGLAYAAGNDTTVSATATFFVGMLINPDALKKGQEELDRVLGRGVLPTFEDEAALPYIGAIAREALRWQTIVPTAVPHYVEVEDEYKGYRIPAGSVVIGNAWAIMHDEEMYPNPFVFNPDRWIKDGKINPAIRDPRAAAFGFGRRICPGRHVAFSSLWLSIASVLAMFDIQKPKDANGNIIEPSTDMDYGLVSHPKPFKAVITPRTKQTEEVVRGLL